MLLLNSKLTLDTGLEENMKPMMEPCNASVKMLRRMKRGQKDLIKIIQSSIRIQMENKCLRIFQFVKSTSPMLRNLKYWEPLFLSLSSSSTSF